MRHVDDDALVLIALGEVPAPATAEHLQVCAQCRAELDATTAVVAAGRDGGPLQAPPEHVWDRIAAEIATIETAQAEEPAPADVVPRPGPARTRPAAPSGPPQRRDRPRGRRGLSRAAWLVAGAAAGVAGSLVVTQWLDEPEPPTALVAQAELAPLPGWAEQGEARVEDAGDRRVLHVEVSGEVTGAFREVWLLDEAAEQLVSVGLLVGSAGSFDLPADLDLEELVLVDVSREPFDGDPAHSGDSIVRGRLGA